MISTVALPILLGAQAQSADADEGFQVPVLEESSELAAPVPTSARSDGDAAAAEPPEDAEVAPSEVPRSEQQERQDAEARGPEDKTLKLTIPQMQRVNGVEIPSVPGDDEEALRNHVAIHLRGTGFPWQSGANTYIAGHRLGYPVTASFLAFYDLDVLEKGDELTVEDADGKVYRYKVYRELIVNPSDLSITQPVRGKDVLTLQTCTLPDYSQRLIVQAEKVA
jgi:sortase A